MTITDNSLAMASAASFENVILAVGAQVLPRKICIIGTGDPAKTALPIETPIRVYSAEEVGDISGFGFMLHRLAKKVYQGSNGIECYIVAQAEAAGAKAAGSFAFSGTATENGNIYLYIGGDRIVIPVSVDDTATVVGDAIEAALTLTDTNAEDVRDYPITAENTTGTVAITAKSEGPWGNGYVLSLNRGFGEDLPAGITCVVTQMTGGTVIPDIDDALEALGRSGTDQANYLGITDLVHGYIQEYAA